MDSNTHSTRHSTGTPAGFSAMVAELQGLADQPLDGLADTARAERVLQLRGLVDRLEGQWLAELAAVDARGAAGAEDGVQAGSTAAWLRNRLRMGAGAAAGFVRTARALYRGPLTGTAQALAEGTISAAHASVLAAGTHDLPDHLTAAAEPVLVAAARRLDPPRLRRAVAHLRLVADPDTAQDRIQRRHQQRGLWVAATWEGMVAVNGLLEPEAGQTLVAALEPLARPTSAADPRSGGQRRADALAELARRTLEAGQLPQTGGIRPQLTVTVDLDSLLGPGGLGGETGGTGPLDPEACRRLACDGAVTRVLVTGHPSHQQHRDHDPSGEQRSAVPAPQGKPRLATPDPTDQQGIATHDPTHQQGLAARLRTAMTLLPPVLGGAPTQPLEVGRTTRVVPPPNVSLWPCATAAVGSPAVPGPWPGARPIICATGCTAAPPTWRIWRCCAGPTTGRSMRAAGGCTATGMVGWPPPHRIEDPNAHPPPPDLQVIPPGGRARRVHGARTPSATMPGACTGIRGGGRRGWGRRARLADGHPACAGLTRLL
jgi:hypothetical protein